MLAAARTPLTSAGRPGGVTVNDASAICDPMEKIAASPRNGYDGATVLVWNAAPFLK